MGSPKPSRWGIVRVSTELQAAIDRRASALGCPPAVLVETILRRGLTHEADGGKGSPAPAAPVAMMTAPSMNPPTMTPPTIEPPSMN